MNQIGKIELHVVDYIIFILTVCLSTGVGLYFGFIRKSAKTLEEYMYGGRKLPLIPVVLSNCASTVTGIAIILFPAESYHYGINFLFAATVAHLGLSFVSYFVIVPVFYALKFTSMFEYLEKRFNKATRRISSAVYSALQILFLTTMIYSSSKAITQVLPVPFHIFTPAAGLLCTLYSAVGGIRGVVWVDVVQFLVMAGTGMVFFFYGIYEVGGVSNAIRINAEGGRFEASCWSYCTQANGGRFVYYAIILRLDIDFYQRYSPIVGTMAMTVHAIILGGTNQGVLQRYLSLPTLKKAKIATIFTGLGNAFLISFPIMFGLVIYALYHDCDPALSQQLKGNSPIVTYYMKDKGRKLIGLNGLFLGGVISAAFSTMSTNLNSIATNLYEDILKPSLPWELNPNQTGLVLKSLAGILGVMVSFGTFAISDKGSLFQIVASALGLVGAYTIFVFLFGALFRKANALSVLIGGIAGIAVTIFLTAGVQSAVNSGKITYHTKIVSIEGCPANITSRLNLNVTTKGYLGYVPTTFSEDLPHLFRICFVNLSLIGIIVSFTIGFIVSLIKPSSNLVIDERLLIPQLRINRRNSANCVANPQELQQLQQRNY